MGHVPLQPPMVHPVVRQFIVGYRLYPPAQKELNHPSEEHADIEPEFLNTV